jgi:hypothetical protein
MNTPEAVEWSAEGYGCFLFLKGKKKGPGKLRYFGSASIAIHAPQTGTIGRAGGRAVDASCAVSYPGPAIWGMCVRGSRSNEGGRSSVIKTSGQVIDASLAVLGSLAAADMPERQKACSAYAIRGAGSDCWRHGHRLQNLKVTDPGIVTWRSAMHSLGLQLDVEALFRLATTCHYKPNIPLLAGLRALLTTCWCWPKERPTLESSGGNTPPSFTVADVESRERGEQGTPGPQTGGTSGPSEQERALLGRTDCVSEEAHANDDLY